MSAMLPGRCDDPECSCRSPELQRFTDQVLRRDANKTDYIIIPLVAGVMVRCVLGDETREANDPLLAEVNAVMALAERARTSGESESWENDLHAYGVIANLVFCNWPAVAFFGGVSYLHVRLGLPMGAPEDQKIAAAVRFLGAHPPPSLTESAIMAVITSMSVSRKRSDMPVLGKSGRRLRVVLADRLRREGLVTWPKILLAAVDDWTVPTLERLARYNAAAGDAAIQYVIDLKDDMADEAQDEPEVTRPSASDAARAPEPSGEAEAAERLIESAVAEIQYWRAQRDSVQHERDNFAQRDARSRSRLESLERQLAAERVRRQELERELEELRAERDRFAERTAAEEAVAADAPPPAPDTFAGKRVLFFTGVESADTRAAVAQGFWDLGAPQVDVYWTEKTRGPDVFPPDAIVALDISLMSHSTSNAILEKAKSAGTWCYWGKHGASTMARATAAAWLARQKRG